MSIETDAPRALFAALAWPDIYRDEAAIALAKRLGFNVAATVHVPARVISQWPRMDGVGENRSLAGRPPILQAAGPVIMMFPPDELPAGARDVYLVLSRADRLRAEVRAVPTPAGLAVVRKLDRGVYLSAALSA